MELSRQEEEFEASEWVLFTKVNEQAFSRDFLKKEPFEYACRNFMSA
jgi:hypothetical protein